MLRALCGASSAKLLSLSAKLKWVRITSHKSEYRVTVHDIHTYIHTDRIAAFITKEGLASLAPIYTNSKQIPSNKSYCVYTKLIACLWSS